jgi:asparagine synthase (glutamine-hydrolysing)
VFNQTPAADEREYVEAVMETCSHLEATLILCDDCWGLREFAGDNGYPLDEPEIFVGRSLMLKPLRRARQDNCRVAMTGTWGDQVLSGEPYDRPLILRDVELTRVPAELPHFCRHSRHPGWWLLAYAYLRPAIPAGVQNWLAHWHRKMGSGVPFMSLYEPTGITLYNLMPSPRLNSQSSQVSYNILTGGLNSAQLITYDNISAYVGMEYRFPFLDRRLIDYMLTLPPRLRFRNGIIKYILRQAMGGVLSEKVRQRTSFAHFSELTERGLREKERARIRELLEDARIVPAGLVDAGRLSAAWTSYWQDYGPFRYRHLVWALCVEVWLRYQEQRGQVDRDGVESVCQL